MASPDDLSDNLNTGPEVISASCAYGEAITKSNFCFTISIKFIIFEDIIISLNLGDSRCLLAKKNNEFI